jgi:hypothetical protein
MLCSKLQAVSGAILNILAVGAGGRKYRAFARFARHRHVAAYHAREMAAHGKAKPGVVADQEAAPPVVGRFENDRS